MSPDRPAPHAPAAVLDVTGDVFAGLSRLRHGRRSLHPRGRSYRATLELHPPAGTAPGSPLFSTPATYAATVRFSRGFGLRQPLPELLGIAMRLHDARGPGVDQDLLVSSSGRRPLLRRVLIPGREGFFGGWFSSVLPFRIGGRRSVFGLHAVTPPVGPEGPDLERLDATARAGGLTFALVLAHEPFGHWVRVGTLRIGAPLPPEESEALSFAAWTTAEDVRPVGLLNTLRAGAYPGSRRGRGLPG
jgi:hypothetical protein